MTHSIRNDEPLIPSDEDTRMASEASRVLAAFVNPRQELRLELKDDSNKVTHMVLPAGITGMVQRILTEIAQGNAVTVIPMNAELTTQEAAEFLNVSRPFLIKQLEAKAIPFRKVGTHRRIGVSDLIKYRRDIDHARNKSLDDLTAEAQRLGLGY